MSDPIKRVFFGCEVTAPWPTQLPPGRVLDPTHRHMTLAFLGETRYDRLQEILPGFPTPPFSVGLAGEFNRCLFLPERHPHVVSWHMRYLDDAAPLRTFQQ